MNIIKNLKNKLRTFIAKETKVNQDKSCPHCRVDEESLKILKERAEEKKKTE